MTVCNYRNYIFFNFSPVNVHWEPSSYDPNPSSWGDTGTKLSDKSSSDKSAFNTFQWPSPAWSDKNKWPGTVASVSPGAGPTPTPAPAPGQVHTWTPTTSWAHNTWTTSTPSPAPTLAAKRVATRQSVLAAPSDPTQPLGEAVTFSSNPASPSSSFNSNSNSFNSNSNSNSFNSNSWPSSQFNSGLLSNVGSVGHGVGNNKPKRPRGNTEKIQKKNEVMSRNYFFTPSPTPLHLRDEKVKELKPSQFQSEFTAFSTLQQHQQQSAFDGLKRFDTDFKTDFHSINNSGRPKKEIKSSDHSKSRVKPQDQNTYYHHGHHDSSAHASEGHDTSAQSKTVPGDHSKDTVQLYIPDPLAPGHPMGDGNHGWAPIEKWAKT